MSVGREGIDESGATGKSAALAVPALPGEQAFGGQEALVVGAGLELAVTVILAVLLAAQG